MGGGETGAASAQSSQQLLEEFRRQRTASQIGQAFQQFGAGVGTQMPYMQQGQGSGLLQQGLAQGQGQGQGAAQPGGVSALGPLFPQQGMGGGGIGGIDEQTLAMILSRLGYGGQGV